MTTITNTLHLGRISGSSAMLALLVGVLVAFMAGVIAPQVAEAQFYTDDYCTNCGWYDVGDVPVYDDYSSSYSSYDGFYTDGYCDGCGSWYDVGDVPVYDDYYSYYDGWYDVGDVPVYDDYYSYYDYNDYYSNEYDYYWDDYQYDYSYYDYNDYDYCTYGCNSGCNSGCNPPPRPEPVCSLDASDTSIEEGDDVELYWTSEYATSATLSSFGSVSTGGTRRVSPDHDTTYTLTVRGNGGTDTCSVRINVEEDNNDDLWCELDVSDSRVEEGDEVTLEWDARGAVRASINQGVGRVDEDGGEEDVEVDRDTTFRLTVEDEDGNEETCSASVRVDEDDDFSSISFDGDPANNPPTVYLSQLPYTGPGDLSPSMIASLAMLAALAGIGGYFFFLKRRAA